MQIMILTPHYLLICSRGREKRTSTYGITDASWGKNFCVRHYIVCEILEIKATLLVVSMLIFVLSCNFLKLLCIFICFWMHGLLDIL